MGVGAYVYLPLSSLQPLAPTAAVSSILSTYLCPTNCVRRFSLFLTSPFFFSSDGFISRFLSLSLRSSPLRFNPKRESRETRLASLLSFLRIRMHQTYASNEECMRTCKRCRLHLVLATSRRWVHALIMSPHASDAYYATADCGLCHDLDQTICSGRACALVKSRTGRTDFVFATDCEFRTLFLFFLIEPDRSSQQARSIKWNSFIIVVLTKIVRLVAGTSSSKKKTILESTTNFN